MAECRYTNFLILHKCKKLYCLKFKNQKFGYLIYSFREIIRRTKKDNFKNPRVEGGICTQNSSIFLVISIQMLFRVVKSRNKLRSMPFSIIGVSNFLRR